MNVLKISYNYNVSPHCTKCAYDYTYIQAVCTFNTNSSLSTLHLDIYVAIKDI